MEWTERRQAICTFLAEFKAAHSFAPTIHQIDGVMSQIPPHLINREFKQV